MMYWGTPEIPDITATQPFISHTIHPYRTELSISFAHWVIQKIRLQESSIMHHIFLGIVCDMASYLLRSILPTKMGN